MRAQLRGALALGAILAVGCQSNDLGLSRSDDAKVVHQPSTIQYRGLCSQTIDFEGFANGHVLDVVFSDGGAGPIAMSGTSTDFPGQNAAIIFDSSNPLPAADDYDLGTPNETFAGPGIGAGGEAGQPWENDTALGNVAIIAENLVDVGGDGNIDVPDDGDLPDSYFTIDFSAVGTGVVTVCEITLLDVEPIEDEGTMELFGPGGVSLATFPIDAAGDNGKRVESLGPTAGVEYMVITLNGSGAIDNLRFEPEEEQGGEGCTPGYWKNHPEDWEGYAPDQPISDMFSGISNFPTLAGDDLMTGLNYGGGPALEGMAKNLVRIAIASVLNASSGNVDYPLSSGDIIDAVNEALGSGSRRDMRDVKDELDGLNNDLPCPL